ncbi:MAG: putative selenate reductase subunit YgfK, partial [Candidatus Bipolaricaulota bacterium]
GVERFEVGQPRQIVHVEELCNACGNCATFCVHEGKPFEDQPRVFLTREAFAEDDGEALLVEPDRVLRRGGTTATLTTRDGGWTYEDPWLRARFARDLSEPEIELRKGFDGERSLRAAAEMAIVHEAVTGTAAYLLAPGSEEDDRG